jgi:hypothetical protein
MLNSLWRRLSVVALGLGLAVVGLAVVGLAAAPSWQGPGKATAAVAPDNWITEGSFFGDPVVVDGSNVGADNWATEGS